ncbi:MAG: SGNH/GDSL hydrolase family protein [Bacteriovoracaceae bacterium]|nr:SGNH/GDSL hydrolase family protein [Bacteriovoracaceae bacterium]
MKIILAVTLSLFLSFLALEGGFRLFGNYLDRCESEIQGQDFNSSTFMKLTKPTLNPHAGFKLCQGFSGKFQGKEFSTNLYGARGKEFLPVKEDNTFRVVGIGDSVMMGWGVSDSETYLSLINQEKGYEGINLGVSGLNAIQEFFHLKERAFDLSPDLIVIGYVGNDWEGENFSRKNNSYASSSQFLNWMIHRVKGISDGDFRVTKDYLEKPGDPLKAYQAMGWLMKQGKIPCIMLLDSRYESGFVSHSNMEKIAKEEMGCEVVNLMTELREIKGLSVQEAISIKDRHNTELIIQGDGHPNSLWHKKVSKLLLQKIKGLQ